MKLKSFKLITIAALLASSFNLSAEVVNVNDASAAALAHYLKGIGDVKAESIVDYRKRNGDFKSLDDLVKVKGIGKGLLKKNRDDLSLSEGVVKWMKSKPKLVVIDQANTVKAQMNKNKEGVKKLASKVPGKQTKKNVEEKK